MGRREGREGREGRGLHTVISRQSTMGEFVRFTHRAAMCVSDEAWTVQQDNVTAAHPKQLTDQVSVLWQSFIKWVKEFIGRKG